MDGFSVVRDLNDSQFDYVLNTQEVRRNSQPVTVSKVLQRARCILQHAV